MVQSENINLVHEIVFDKACTRCPSRFDAMEDRTPEGKTRSWEMTRPVLMWQWHVSKHSP